MIDSLFLKLAQDSLREDMPTIGRGGIWIIQSTAGIMRNMTYGRMSRHSHIIFIIELMTMYLKVSCHKSRKRH
jgi:hypothetical protein